MEQQVKYQLLWDHVDKLMERRQNVSAIYLSVNAAIVAAISFLVKDAALTGWMQRTSLLLLLISGVIVCDLWRRLLAQYKTLASWWYERLRELEDSMGDTNKFIIREYQELYLANANSKARIGLTRYETLLTWIFTILYLIFALAMFVSIFVWT